jgi:hypothetical protein
MERDGQLDSVCQVSTQAGPNLPYVDYLSILHGRPDGTFDSNPLASIPLSNNDFTGPAYIADINGDGLPDIIAYSNNGMSVFIGQPDLRFAPFVYYSFYNLGGFNPYQPDALGKA